MSTADLQANKALVLAHYDAVTNGHDPAAIHAQVAPDFFDHAVGAAMSADEVIAHSRDLHAASAACMRRRKTSLRKAIWSLPAWCGAVCISVLGRALPLPEDAWNFAA